MVFSTPIVEAVASDWVAEQKLPNPWVGITRVWSGSSAASRCAEAYWWCTRSWVCPGPSRSGRPVEPNSSDPPENTAVALPCSSST